MVRVRVSFFTLYFPARRPLKISDDSDMVCCEERKAPGMARGRCAA